MKKKINHKKMIEMEEENLVVKLQEFK